MLGNKSIMSKNIIKFMKENNVDRRKLSKDLNIKYTTLSDWINAKTYPRIDKIEMLANYFNVNKSDLVEDKSTINSIDTLPVREIQSFPKLVLDFLFTPKKIFLERTYIATKQLNSSKEIFGLRVSGDSMDKNLEMVM